MEQNNKNIVESFDEETILNKGDLNHLVGSELSFNQNQNNCTTKDNFLKKNDKMNLEELNTKNITISSKKESIIYLNNISNEINKVKNQISKCKCDIDVLIKSSHFLKESYKKVFSENYTSFLSRYNEFKDELNNS